jgi:hypothetical protein
MIHTSVYRRLRARSCPGGAYQFIFNTYQLTSSYSEVVRHIPNEKRQHCCGNMFVDLTKPPIGSSGAKRTGELGGVINRSFASTAQHINQTNKLTNKQTNHRTKTKPRRITSRSSKKERGQQPRSSINTTIAPAKELTRSTAGGGAVQVANETHTHTNERINKDKTEIHTLRKQTPHTYEYRQTDGMLNQKLFIINQTQMSKTKTNQLDRQTDSLPDATARRLD